MLRQTLLAALLCAASALSQIENIDHPNRVPGEYLVVLKPAPSEVQMKASYIQEAIAKIRGISAEIRLIKKFDALRSPILHFRADDATIRRALQFSEVTFIEANLKDVKVQQCMVQNTGQGYWGLSRISARPPPSPYSNGFYSHRFRGGDGVKVYDLGTGIRTTHGEFSGGRAIFGVNTVGGEDSDIHGHGTHCAGIAVGFNTGVAKGATVVAVKVVHDNAGGTVDSVIDGINWVRRDLQSGGRGVINLALTSPASASLDSAVESTVADNIPVIAAAGNDNGNACNVSPARSDAAITVASTGITEGLSTFSNYGGCIDILAPGSNIRSASNTDDYEYQNLSGTSMASAFVSGAVAVYLESNPNASPDEVREHLIGTASKDYIDMRGTGWATPNRLLYEYCV